MAEELIIELIGAEFICDSDDFDESEELDEHADIPTTAAAANATAAADLYWIFFMR